MLLLISNGRWEYTILLWLKKIQAYCAAIINHQLADMPVCQTGPVLLCDVSTGSPRPIVPSALC